MLWTCKYDNITFCSHFHWYLSVLNCPLTNSNSGVTSWSNIFSKKSNSVTYDFAKVIGEYLKQLATYKYKTNDCLKFNGMIKASPLLQKNESMSSMTLIRYWQMGKCEYNILKIFLKFCHYKIFFRLIGNIAFHKNVFIFWYSYMITNFIFRVFLIIS